MQKTDLNVSPYYDDYTEDNNFHRVLFRPSFSVQARELTQLQSILQNQIERFGSHFFKEGSMVIPGQCGFDITYSYVKLQANFNDGSTTHTVENYRTSLVGKKLTGVTSKVIAKVVNAVAASGSDELTLYVKYESSGTDVGSTTNFAFGNGEALNIDTAISYTAGGASYTINANTQVATTIAANATGTGSAAYVEKGVYFIRGTFVQVAAQTIILDKYTNTPTYRVGFTITESLSTPEEDTTLLDNATGSSNYTAKGAHRLKYTLTLSKKTTGTTDDADFVELLRLQSGRAQSQVRSTDYSVLEETLARRTFDESGNYIVRGFDINMREHLDTGLNNGLFTAANGGDASKVGITLSPGKAYVKGFEIATIGQTVVPLDKARSTNFVQNYPTTFSAGNFIQVENVFGTPDIDSSGSNVLPFREVEIRDQRLPVTHLNISSPGTLANSVGNGGTITVDSTSKFPSSGAFLIRIGNELINVVTTNATTFTVQTNGRGYLGTTTPATHADHSIVVGWGIDPQTTTNSRANVIGVARTRAFEHGTGSEDSNYISGAYPLGTRFQHYLFDVRMLCKLTLDGPHGSISGTTASNTTITNITTTNIKVGMFVTGTGIDVSGVGTTVASIDVAGASNDGTITISRNATASGNSTDLSFSAELSAQNLLHNGAKLTGSITGATGFVFITKQDIANSAANGTTDGKVLNDGATVHVIQTTGTFQAGEKIISNVAGDLGGTSPAGGETLLHPTTKPVYFNMGDAHSVFSDDAGSNYVADIFPSSVKQLTGSVSVTAGSGEQTVSGTNTGFLSDLKAGDLIEVQDVGGNIRRFEVDVINSDTSLETVEKFHTDVTNSTILRVRSRIEEQEELVMLSKLPKPAIKTLKTATLNNQVDTTLTVRRQQVVTLTGTTGNISLPEGESFVSFNADDYLISVLDPNTGGGGATFAAGQNLAPSTDSNATCKLSITTTGLTITLGGGVTNMTLKVIFTVQIATSTEKTKTLVPSQTLHIRNEKGNIYGTNYKDLDITLQKADIFKVRGVFMGTSSTDAETPSVTYNNGTGGDVVDEIFQPGEKIIGSNGAIARTVSTTADNTNNVATTKIVYLTTKTFTTGITLTSEQRSFSNILTTTAVAAGSTNILNDFFVDTGMRDTFYDIGRISRKAAAAPPTGRLLIVYDYFTHGAGDYFSVDSYPVGTSATSITYEEIPLYSAQRVDPDTISPTGEYELRDTIDFRPRVGDVDVISASNDGSGEMTSGELNTNSISAFQFNNRNFTVGTSSLVDVPKTDNTFLASFDYYLPQNAALFLDSEGEFKTVVGGAAENPERPKPIDDAMQLAAFRIPQYTFDPLDIGVRRLKNRRYTMRDIGAISERVNNLEYFTQLNLLEKDTETFQIQDSDGLDRFKNGFIVDNFRGHGTGDASHPDYKNSMDMAVGLLRPEYMSRVVELDESVSTDTLRTAAGYRKTGDLITLPYTETTFVSQPYASRIENVNPFNVIAWVGSLELDPASDIWKDTNRLPNLIINREGNYDTLIARNGGSAMNTVWNEWETFWTGETSTTEEWRDTSWETARAQVPFRRVMERTTTTETRLQTRSGTTTFVVPRIDYESKGDKILSTEILPFCRARDVNFTGSVFKPLTRLYAFFDNVDVTQYITPSAPYVNKYNSLSANINDSVTTIGVVSTSLFESSGTIQIDDEQITYTGKTNSSPFQFTGCTRGVNGTTAASHSSGAKVYSINMGDPLISGATGKLAGKFSIPDPNVSGNPAFPVGERILRLTSDTTNGILSGDTQTSGEATYFAKGLLDNIQETVIATRNAEEVRVTVNDARSVTSTRTSDRQIGWWDPVAQSFLIDEKGGAFITSVDCYFQSKSETVPVQCQIRTMKNGYPSTTILPFSKSTVEPENVNISDDASVATTFTFPSPVYLMQDIEYCFVILANTQDYHIWLSHMGDQEIGGTRMISDQPYAGVLFKSQNASTWTASQMEDLKFNIKRASFSTTSGVVTLHNKGLENTILENNPITPIPGTKKILVRHKNHGMYDTANNVTLSDVGGTVQDSGSATYQLSSLNATYTSISEMGLDHYIIDLASLGNAPTNNFATAENVGGIGVKATENYMMDTMKSVLQIMEVSGTSTSTSIRTTSGSSPSSTAGVSGGAETSFQLAATSSAKIISPNENVSFENPQMVASTINETNEMTGNKSFETLITMSTTLENLSPALDTQRMGIFTIQNRLNNINVNTDLYSTGVLNKDTTLTDAYKASTAPEGDNNAAIYCTRKVTLENAATAIKVLFDAIRFSEASIEVYYKIQESDDTTQFEDLAWIEMTADKSIAESKNYQDYRENTFEASGLNSFISFAIKIVMKGTNSAEPPLIKDLRAIALAL